MIYAACGCQVKAKGNPFQNCPFIVRIIRPSYFTSSSSLKLSILKDSVLNGKGWAWL